MKDCKEQPDNKKLARLRLLVGVDLCACGAMHTLRCQGCCREAHRDIATGVTRCGELYRVELPRRNDRRSRKPRRFNPAPKSEAHEQYFDRQR